MPEYVWIIIGGVVILFAVIGFIADKRKPKKDVSMTEEVAPEKPKKEKKGKEKKEESIEKEPEKKEETPIVAEPQAIEPMNSSPFAFEETTAGVDFSAPLEESKTSEIAVEDVPADIFSPMTGNSVADQVTINSPFPENTSVDSSNVDPTLFQPIGDISSQTSFPEVDNNTNQNTQF